MHTDLMTKILPLLLDCKVEGMKLLFSLLLRQFCLGQQ
jgi:hypothetical protein